MQEINGQDRKRMCRNDQVEAKIGKKNRDKQEDKKTTQSDSSDNVTQADF